MIYVGATRLSPFCVTVFKSLFIFVFFIVPTTPGTYTYRRTLSLLDALPIFAIDARLAQSDRIALTSGVAVAMGQPYPVTLERLAEWTGELTARGFAVAPVSAVVDLQKAP